ncbi:hypothetical protein FOL47_000475 [Perkinsus chesapeaki]|uniref:Uncharacterized protein n=1 Tax=Perkinsus chesapeaki TaxID=330153 RepID=A0A7J6MLZ1_PERCH|nr:hypothetical protein FOL47_000475 [Perkinsus chesapeaki]
MNQENSAKNCTSSSSSPRSDTSVEGTEPSVVRLETADIINQEEPSDSDGKSSSDKNVVDNATDGDSNKKEETELIQDENSPGADPIGWAIDKLLSRIVKENSLEQLVGLLSEMTKRALILQNQLDISNLRNNELIKEIDELKNALQEERQQVAAPEPPTPPPLIAPTTSTTPVMGPSAYDGIAEHQVDDTSMLQQQASPGRVTGATQLNELYEMHHIDRDVRSMLSGSRKIKRPDQRQMVIDLFLDRVGHERGKDVLAALKGASDVNSGDLKTTPDSRSRRNGSRRSSSDQHPLQARPGPENRSWLFAQCIREVEAKIPLPATHRHPRGGSGSRNDYYYERAKWGYPGGSSSSGRNHEAVRAGGGWNGRRDATGW